MAGTDRLYPEIGTYDLEPPQVPASAGGSGEEEAGVCDALVMWDDESDACPSHEAAPIIFEKGTRDPPPKVFKEERLDVVHYSEFSDEMATEKEFGENNYDSFPSCEQTGIIWVPPSVPPMPKHDHDEWQKGFGYNSPCFPEEEYKWDIDEENLEMTMWDVLSEMVVAGKDKILSIASFDLGMYGTSMISDFCLEETLKDKAQTLKDVSAGSEHALLETELTKWLPDSASTSCMLCGARFHPIICARHHCRFCGGIFCGGCSKGRSLMPPKFMNSDPQRVCDVCGVRLECIQPYLMNRFSRACQLPTQDLTDLSTLRSWINTPWAVRMEYEIYKAANSIHGYCKVGELKPEKSIPDSILRQAKGLAIITEVKVGVMLTYKIGTGLVVARRGDGSWSPPSAISTCGLGYGVQAGGELADYIIVLRNKDAIKTFSGNAHMSIGAGVSASAGHFGRVAEADFRAGDGGYAACYTYSCSKGAFVGCALNGSVVSTRDSVNARFYGGPIKASEILLGSLPKPPVAATLYKALSILFDKIEK
uniref:Zinc ion binding protein n=1 Tax=Zea mays TaxID=4577 RepID=B6SKK2_MAIZE|nr:zinc ion binding protein [Zea mays]|eukprot:NP_001147080.1 uncharacterized protein LOC100280689 [Zea mays]